MTKTKYEAMCRETYPCKKCQGTGTIFVVKKDGVRANPETCPACKGKKYFLPYDLHHGQMKIRKTSNDKPTLDQIPELLNGYCSQNCPWYIGCEWYGTNDCDENYPHYPESKECPRYTDGKCP